MTALYFAYGSNLASARMRARVPSAHARGLARLGGRCLRFDKRGRDGSGKANVPEDPSAVVWGVIYAFEAHHWAALDRCEPGYTRTRLEVQTEQGERIGVETYVAHDLTSKPVPFAWYKRLVVDGAREHGLPADYVKALERVPTRAAPPEKPAR